MDETHSRDNQIRGTRRRLRACGAILRRGVDRNVRSSLRVSVGFEANVALLVFYAVVSFMVFDYLGKLIT